MTCHFGAHPPKHLTGGQGPSHRGGRYAPGAAATEAKAPKKSPSKTSPKTNRFIPIRCRRGRPPTPTPEAARENQSGAQVDLKHGDALELLKATPGEHVQCITTDPPYESLDKWRGVGTTTRLGGGGLKDADNRDDWFSTISNDKLRETIGECVRVLKKDGHLWMMCDGATLGHVLMQAAQMQSDGKISYFKPFPVVKMTNGGKKKQGMGYHGRACHEYVVLMKKGKKQRSLNERNFPDVFEAIWDGGKDSAAFTDDGENYPTAKPPSLLRQWVALSTHKGEKVLDPFMGSGSAGVAATTLGRDFVGFDLSPKSISAVRRRLNQEP